MRQPYKTINISDLIQLLNTAKDRNGDLKVIVSGDCEGNDYGTLDKEYSIEVHNNLCVIYPAIDKIDIEDVEEYLYDDPIENDCE